MARLMSPVNAPEGSGRPDWDPVRMPAAMHFWRSMCVGNTATSTFFRGRYGESLPSHPAGGGFIFQLAAMRHFLLNILFCCCNDNMKVLSSAEGPLSSACAALERSVAERMQKPVGRGYPCPT